MKKLFLFMVVMLSLICVKSALSAPTAVISIINNETEQCAEFWGGDECYYCYIPQGWEEYELWPECPEGYEVLEGSDTEVLDFNCHPSKSGFCCTESHSGMGGDCEDMVINQNTEECAFVEEISNCSLPPSWSGRSADIQIYEWLCPLEFEWISEVNCAYEEEGQQDMIWLILALILVILIILAIIVFIRIRKK